MHLGFLNFSFLLFYLFLFLFVFVGVCFRGGEICNYHYNIASSSITKKYIYILKENIFIIIIIIIGSIKTVSLKFIWQIWEKWGVGVDDFSISGEIALGGKMVKLHYWEQRDKRDDGVDSVPFMAESSKRIVTITIISKHSSFFFASEAAGLIHAS